MSNINEISADKSNGCVSKGCWVISQEADNQARRYSTINAGQQKGTIHSISGGMDISEWIKNNFKAIPGQQINIVQGVGVTAGPGDGIPLPAPTGEPRVINFSGNSKVLPLKSPNGQEYLSLIIKQLNFDIKIRCNEEIEIHFADLEIKNVNDNFKNFPKPLFPWPQLSIVFSIDSVPVSRGWEYSIGYWMESDNHNLIIQQGSRSICNIAFLGAKDEIILAAPSKTMNFVWNNQKELPPTKIFARVSWRSRLDGTIG